MSPRPEDDPTSADSTRAGGLANVFRSLTSSKGTSKSPPLPAPAAALPRTEFVNAIPTSSRELSTNHMDAYELLRSGTQSERISAANTLKYAITEDPVNPVLDIWYAAKDLIDPTNQPPMRMAGWELLTECAKHTSSTDLERKEYFQTLSAPANPEDFHMQLAALVDLSNHGRVTTGFEYDLIPLVTDWLQEAYKAARRARKNAQSTRGQRSSSRGRAAASGEEKNLAQLFQFLLDVIKFSSNNANETSITGLIESVLAICINTSVEDDLRSCIGVLDAIVTFGSIPQDKLKDCIQVLSSIFCLVPALQKNSWHTIANLCKSHNGQATVRILLNILRNLSADGARDKDTSREVRGAVAVLQKLLSKTTEKGYPTVPYALLVDGLSNALRATSSPRVYGVLLQLINSLFNDGHGRIHRLIVDEDWSVCLEVAAECFKRVNSDPDRRRNSQPKEESPEVTVDRELLTLIGRLDAIIKQKPGDFVPREAIIKFFTDVHALLPDATVRTVLDYFQEFRCCSPSDLRWEENLALVLDAFYSNRNRSSETRLRALQTTMNAYEIVDLVGDGAEQNLIPRLAKSILQNVAEETDVPVLEAIMSLMVSVVTSCDLDLFDYIIDTLRGIVVNDQLKSPVASPATPASMSPPVLGASGASVEQSPSNVVTKGYVKMFLRVMNSHGEKSARLFNALVSIAKPSHCEVDARLTAMKLLFRLRADWANRIFVTDDPENSFLATAMYRTDASFAKKQAEEAAQSLRLSRSEHGGQSRASRGVSFGQGPTHERSVPARTPSATKRTHQRYRQLWSYPDPEAVPDAIPALISPVLVSHVSQPEEAVDGDDGSSPRSEASGTSDLGLSAWLGALLTILQGSDWEVYSFVLVHLPSQLSNHAIFKDAKAQVQELRRIICEQIRTNGFQAPPNASGLRRADVAICLFHSLTMILSYHEHFSKSDEDDIVKTFVLGIATWERTAKYCIHALSICCHELPLSTSKSLIQMLNQMAAIITQPHVSVHILEFLASLSRLHNVFVNFREDDFRIVFGICFRYLEYAKEKRPPNRSHASEMSTPVTPSSNTAELSNTASPSDDLPQYVHALAYHVILFWFLALKLQDRSHHVGWIVKKLFSDGDGAGQTADEQTLTSIDFMQRVAYADVDESAEDPYFTKDRFGAIIKKQWVVGNSIITIKQATVSGWAQIIKRQPSGTSAYTVRETFMPPPAHQTEAHVDVSREGQATTNAILPSHLLIQLMSPVPQTFESARPIPLPDDEATERAIRVFDRNSSLDGHKVGVVYIGEGQTEEADILANVSGSNDYLEFLNNLGTLTKLKGATFNTQGLDREYDTDGQYTFCWRDRVTEIVFHVTTQMPTNLERDAHCTLKKRHIGNDFVNIIFNDSGVPFKFDTFPSQFNFVNIVITPASRASFIATREADSEKGKNRKQPFYRVQVICKPGFPEVSPASETKMISLKALPGFIRLLALNASMFSVVWHNREGGEHISSWSGRLREIKRLRDKHGPKGTNLAPSPPPTSFGAHPQAQQADSSRPSSSVRDSFNSLRRTSVATFFTSTSEQTSHRSSTLSTLPTPNDTEQPPPTGVSSLVESVDFSKWA
ncbi:Tuberous sclerosis 2 protein [Tolypocladium ophioglossoides CBS 100239]|uniref:Tuberous sclerosis 2 protein n=1 Tax=Tolypocladium ophioglossoides (strain CBS 100239) TaxID=1163406 RepID=A0A0L0NIU2_TOLOC|nr:Tuberous sclerosis 2 protein [Tolypocladium ophioglossoides CBS 100239]